MTTHARLLLLSLALGSSVFARPESSLVPPGSNRPLGPVLAVLDSNHDGMLSAEEIAAAPMALAALDRNGDGLISPDERRATNPEGRPVRAGRGAAAFNVVLTLDANLDGDIQTMEIANAVSSLKRLDRNGDGQLTRDELLPSIVAQHRA